MADNFHAGILAGATSITIPVVFRDTASNQGETGLTNAEMTASYWRPGSSRVAITVNSVASVQAAFTSGGFIQVDATNCPGLYRFDIPNQAIDTGKDWVVIAIQGTGVFTYYERFNLITQTPKTVYDSMATIAAVESGRADLATDIAALDFATQAELESARADLAADIASVGYSVSFSAAKAGITNFRLNELIGEDAVGAPPAVGTHLDLMMNKSHTVQSYSRSNDSLEAIRDRGDAAWAGAGGGLSTGDVSGIVSNRVDAALIAKNLDHLAFLSAPVGVPVSNTVMDRMMNKDANKTFDPSSDSLEAIRDRGDTSWVTGGGGAAPNTNAIESACIKALSGQRLHYLMMTSANVSNIATGSLVRRIMTTENIGPGGDTFDPMTHSLFALRTQGDSAWITATGFATDTDVDNAVESARADIVASHATPANVESARAALNTDHTTLALRTYQESVRADLAADIAALNDIAASDVTGPVESARADLATDIAGLNDPTIASVSAAVAQALADYPVATSGAAAGGGATIGSIEAAVWQYSLSASVAQGTAAYILRSAADNAGAIVSGAVSSGDIDNIWNRLRGSNNASGSMGEAINIAYGSGDVPVNHNTGGSDNLTLQDASAAGIDEARIRIYLKGNYDSGLITVPYIKGQSITDANGQWKHPVYLDSGSTYTIVYSKPGSIETTTKEITI
jgi:hypothetical protein